LQLLRLQVLWQIFKETIRRFFAIKGPFLASGLAFDVLLYCIPLLFLMLSAVGYVFAISDHAIVNAQQILGQLLPGSDQIVANNLDYIVAKRGQFGIFGFVLYLLISTATFGTVRMVLNTVMEVKQPRGFLKGKTVDLLMLLAASGLFILIVGISSLVAVLQGVDQQLPLLGFLIGPGLAMTSHVLGFLFTVSLFYLLYRYCPARGLKGTNLWVACLIGAILFEISKWMFAWYVSVARSYVLLYGTLSGFLFFFLWIYYVSIVFIFSATLGRVLENQTQDS
jgi:membrane protein